VKRRRVEIAAWLGFPGTAATLNVLAKVPPGSATLPNLLRLRSPLREPDPPKAPFHLPVVDAFTIRVLTSERLRERAAFSLLADMEASGYFVSRGASAYVLEDTLRLEDALAIDSRRPIRSRDELSRLHAERIREFELREHDLALGSVVFPDPPVAGAGGIVPITDARDLLREGREMHHCVGSYAPDVAAGRVFVYRVLAPARATVALGATPAGWHIRQMKGPANERASPAAARAVRRWLRGTVGALHPSSRPNPTAEEPFGEDEVEW